jgi:uncharacterized protein YceK
MKKIAFIFIVSILFSGCASTPKQSFNKEQNKDIKSIALINAPYVDGVPVHILHHPGTSFGLIGGMVAIADMNAKTASYKEKTKDQSIDWNEYTKNQIKTQLEKNGYQVKLVQQRGAKAKAQEFLTEYPKTDTDAVFDYKFLVRQLATGAGTAYIPTATLQARMIKSSGKSIIYEEQFNAGNPSIAGDGVKLGTDSKGYKNIDELNQHPAQSMNELKQAVDKIAQRIGHDLRK